EEEIRRPKVQTELGRWTLVVLDADRDAAAARSLSVGAIPALRLLTPTGRLVASSEGYMPADKLLEWLGRYYDAASRAAAEELADEGELTTPIITKLVALLRNRDPALREVAVRRLLPRPELAAREVAGEFATGPLQARLAALELLREWQAPVADLDPWRPE